MLLERDREVELLADLLAGVGSSGGKVVLIRGEAGIGKTSLVKEFVERHCDEAHVLSGSCDDLSTPQPLGPFYDIARTEPGIRQALNDGNRPALFEALVDVLSRTLRPTVLVIEDTQWADGATLDAITYLGRRVGSSNGLLLLTYRDEEVDYDHLLRTVIGDLSPTDLARVTLEALSVEAVESMLDGSHDLAEVMRLTNGNPLFVGEIIAGPKDQQIPQSVTDSALARVARLSEQSRRLLTVLSVIPERISLDEVRDLADDVDEALQECTAGFIDITANSVEFRHELVRRAIEQSLTPMKRIDANRRILTELQSDGDPARMTHHAIEAGDVEAILRFAPVAAAAAAAVGSNREAIAHYQAVEPHLDQLEANERGLVLDAWVTTELRAGRDEETVRVAQLRVAHHRAQGHRSAELAALAALSSAYMFTGRVAEAEEVAHHAIDMVGAEVPAFDLVPVYEVLAWMAMMRSDAPATRQWVERTLEAAGPDADETLIIRCLIDLGTAEDLTRYPSGRADLEEAVERSIAIGDWWNARRALHNHAFTAAEALDLPTALDYTKRSLSAADHYDTRGTARYSTATHAKVLESTGNWSDAENRAREAAGGHMLAHMVVQPIIGSIEARHGRTGARNNLIEAWNRAYETGDPARMAPAGAALAEYAWISGDPDIAMDEIKDGLDRIVEVAPWWRSSGFLALWLWKLGVLEETPEEIAEPYRLIIDCQPLEAAEQWAELGYPYEEAIALSHGPPDAQLQALEKLDTLGATAVAAKLRQQLRDQGVKVPRGRAHSTRKHGAGLTARQAEVLQLLTEGLTNPEIADRLFVSPRTVEHHVSAVLSKLDATTRQDAVTRAREQGLLVDATQ